MAGGFSAIDLSQLPAPDAVQTVDYEATLAAMLADLRARAPEFDALVESDPAFKLMEAAAYFKVLTLQRVNDAARAVMPAYSMGADLDQIAARYGVVRLVIDAGDPAALPPIAPALETDDDLRRRMLLSFEGLSTAGPVGSYIFHALGADADVADASVQSPAPGEVLVTILSRTGDGTAAPAVIAAVLSVLNADEVRPLCDQVSVQAAEIITFAVSATLTVYPGPDSAVVREAAEVAVRAYVDAQHRLGRDVTLSGLYAALHQPGVQKVTLTEPAADLPINYGQAAYCNGLNVQLGGVNV